MTAYRTITLPDHAIRFLKHLCKQERERLAKVEPIGNMLQLMASHDSLEEIEAVLPENI